MFFVYVLYVYVQDHSKHKLHKGSTDYNNIHYNYASLMHPVFDTYEGGSGLFVGTKSNVCLLQVLCFAPTVLKHAVEVNRRQ